MKKEKLLESLYKRAEGFTVEETVTEYIIDEDGTRRPIKEKTQNKYVPPDISATKAYFELAEKQDDVSLMTDEELEAERIKLIKSLKKTKGSQSS